MNKPTCPYCGNEMTPGSICFTSENTMYCYAVCNNCNSQGPRITASRRKNLYRLPNQVEERLKNRAMNVAMKRKTHVPMMLDELKECLKHPPFDPVYIETKQRCGFQTNINISPAFFSPVDDTFNGMMQYYVFGSDVKYHVDISGYGKYWRVWKEKPSDIEQYNTSWED